MSHHYEWEDPETKLTWYANFNGDFSGDIDMGAYETENPCVPISITSHGGLGSRVPSEFIFRLTAEHVQRTRINKIEDQEWFDTLGLESVDG